MTYLVNGSWFLAEDLLKHPLIPGEASSGQLSGPTACPTSQLDDVSD